MKKLVLFVLGLFALSIFTNAYHFNFNFNPSKNVKLIQSLNLNVVQLFPAVNLVDEQVSRVTCFATSCGYSVNFLFTPSGQISSATLKIVDAQGNPAPVIYSNGQFLSQVQLPIVNSGVQNAYAQAVLIQQDPNHVLRNNQMLANNFWNIEVCNANGQCAMAQQNRPIN